MKTARITALLMSLALTASVCSANPDWPRQYQPIDDPAAAAFIDRGLAFAKQLLGEPRVPVQRVDLRRSAPLHPASKIRRGFRLCEITDPQHGVFTIYVSRAPGEYAFHGQLAHEIAHLLNARLFDMYIEGLNTAFAQRLLRKEGMDWSGWKTYLEHQDPFYGATYAMMKRVWDLVGDQHIKTLLSYAIPSDPAHTKMRIDIDAWLDALPPELRPKARAIIREHAPAVNAAMKGHPGYQFAQPKNG